MAVWQMMKAYRLLKTVPLALFALAAGCDNSPTAVDAGKQRTEAARKAALDRLHSRLEKQNQEVLKHKISLEKIANRSVDTKTGNRLAPFQPVRRPTLITKAAPTTPAAPELPSVSVPIPDFARENSSASKTAKAIPATRNPNETAIVAGIDSVSPLVKPVSVVAPPIKPGSTTDGEPALAISPPASAQSSFEGPIGRFRSKLAALKSGQRTKPVTILHIGDSHVASDSFSRGVRTTLQNRFGNAGRGMVIPAAAFKYGIADQVRLTRSGRWRSRTALKTRNGSFGISGVNVTASSSNAVMRMSPTNGSFDWAEVTALIGPKQGKFVVTVGKVSKEFNARSQTKGSKTFRVEAKGRTLEVKPSGRSRLTMLNWATGRERPGIRYVNFGLIGATLAITKRFNKKLIENDVRRLDPDLLVYGFGTNEGFNDRLNLKKYREDLENFVGLLRSAAPNADLVYLGAASGLRRRGKGKSCGGGWRAPPKLAALRKMKKDMARENNVGYWDWSAAMGGACAVNSWAKRRLAARDRVHLTSRGYLRSAKSFAAWLSRVGDDPTTVALKNTPTQ